MILNLTELKTLLNITGTEQDDLLSLELDITEDFIVNYTHNYFLDERLFFYDNSIFDEANNTIQIQNKNSLRNFTENLQIRVFGSNLNDNIYTITEINDDLITVNKELESEENELRKLIQVVKYPKSLKTIQAEMVKFNLLTAEKAGIKSEKISRHSVNYGTDTTNAYPDFIIKKLNTFNRIIF